MRGVAALLLLAAALQTRAIQLPFVQHVGELSTAEAHTKLASAFFKSDDLGVSHCELQGVIGEEDVTLHVWLRMALRSAIDDGKLKTCIVRGFALLQSATLSIPTGGPVGLQLLQAGSVNVFSKNIYLRSYTSGVEYPLNVTLYPNSRYRPWDISEPSEGWTNHVMDIDAEFELNDKDVTQTDFELRADGFDWHCPFLVESPVLGYRQPYMGPMRQPGDSWVGGEERQWRHQRKASLTDRTQVWQILSPFYRVTVHDYATLLWHRVMWHEQLGMQRYILYVYESLSPLIREPLIQELISRGSLYVILYTDMPKHEKRPLHPTATDLYTMQVLAYNHALLSLWGTDSLVLVADVDEYVMTHKPMTVVEAFKQCRETPTPTLLSAGLQVRRTDAVCAPDVEPWQCSTSVPGLLLWTNNTLPDVRAGRAAHPLSWHAMNAGGDLWDHHNTKALLDVNLARDVHVHFFRGAPGSSRDNASPDCMRLLHLVDLYKVRYDKRAAWQDSARAGDSAWWWTVDRIQQAAKGREQGG